MLKEGDFKPLAPPTQQEREAWDGGVAHGAQSKARATHREKPEVIKTLEELAEATPEGSRRHPQKLY